MDSDKFYAMLADSKLAARQLAQAPSRLRNAALAEVADTLENNWQEVAAANSADIARGRESGMAAGLLDRLLLDEDRVRALAAAVRSVIGLTDPVGEVVRGSTLENGLLLQQVRVPLGVVGAIYEARPNVTVDIAALALKSGNAVVLRGGSAAQSSNRVLVELLQRALQKVGLPSSCVQTIDEFGRAGATELMRARGYVDVLIPRGSQGLINTVMEEAKVPVIETGAGVVHIYIDGSADLDRAVEIVCNAKAQRPGVCNAVDTLLVHAGVADVLLPRLARALAEYQVEVFGCNTALGLVPQWREATSETWGTEHLSLRLGVRIVPDLESAFEHIAAYSTGHTEAVIAEDYSVVERFLREVDAASVIANASTRFTDGGVFGFGAEVGISTQKLHARGPMGLPELTSTKWIVRGSGQIRA